jgi:hypothetical protein
MVFQEFTAQITDIYDELMKKGEAFEIVLVYSDDEEEDFKNIMQACHGLLCHLEIGFGLNCIDTFKLSVSQP